MKITIKEIAKLAGVSTTTVSHILNNKGKRFSPETQRKVLEIVEEYDYKPNFFAQNMVTKHSKTIGMIVPDVTDFFFSKVIEGVETYLKQKGYMILLCNSNHSEEKEKLYIDQLLRRSVDGIILASPNSLEVEKLIELKKQKVVQYVLIDRGLNEREEGNILVKEYEGSYEATKYLIDLGHRNIGMVTNKTGYYKMTDRYLAYKKCLEDHGIPFRSDWVVNGAVTIKGGYLAAKELLSRTSELTAIFCGNDQMAMGTYRAIDESGRSVPEDISVIGYDGLEIAEYMVPALTTVLQPSFEIGYTAAEFLVASIDEPTMKVPNQTYETILLKRNSVVKLDRF